MIRPCAASSATPGGGARFWLEFDAEADAAVAQTETAEAPAQGETGGFRVLAAEDHPVNRQVLQALLEPLGLALVFAENGLQALETITASSFGLVLMDVNMPVMDGVDALKAIRQMDGEAARTPVFMLTANVFDEDVRRYLAEGADGVLKKPIDVQELYRVIGEAAAGAFAREEPLRASA